MDSITIKRGDTLRFTCAFRQGITGNPPVDLSSSVVTVSVMYDNDIPAIEVVSNAQTAFRTISTDALSAGTFVVNIKDTEVLIDSVYYIDFKLTTVDGIEQTTKSIKLIVKDRLV